MSVRVEQTALAGIGVRNDLITAAGRRIGVVSHRDGHRTLIIAELDDPDSCAASIPLSDDEADALAEILGSSLVLGRIARLEESVAGLFTEHIEISTISPFVGRKLGDTKMRTRTTASIVAVLRDGDVIASPDPLFRFQAGDVVVVVGTRKALDKAATILAGTPG